MPAMAACGFDWARVQMLSEQDPAAAALEEVDAG